MDSEYKEKEAQTTLANASSGEIIIGVVSGISNAGMPLVDYPGNPEPQSLSAITTVVIHHQHINRQVALLFNQGDARAPVIMGLIQNPLDAMLELEPESASPDAPELPAESSTDEVYIDGKKLVIEGKEQVVLKCGEASITLTKAGKILIRGKYLLNRSSGVNRIMGGSVQIN